MKITSAEITISAVSKQQYPKETSLPEIALAGRSNVGKSSFINTMIKRKSLARTSSKPGKTQTLNFYKLNDTFFFVDVPGYGYAKISKQERAKWGPMMEEYFETRENLKAVVLITDIRHKPTKSDIQMYHYLKHLNHPVTIVPTKLDKVSRSRKDQFINQTKNSFQLAKEDDLIPFSAVTKEGKKEAWDRLKRYL